MTTDCPADAVLAAWVERSHGRPDPPPAGTAAPSAVPAEDGLAAHVARCPTCRARYADFQADMQLCGDLSALLTDPEDHGYGPELVVPGYRIERELSRGNQGIVYQAVQLATRRVVALKMLAAGPLAGLRERARFAREIELAAGLRHPNIIAIYEVLTLANGRMAYTMSLIEGEPLDAWRSRQPAPPTLVTRREHVRRVVRMFETLCDAVGFAHLRGVIHRDLKPANILVDAHSKPHILDFGLAKALDQPVDAAMTQTGCFVGTPLYAAPEQFSGKGDAADTRTDVYALGLILYELLTGRLPFRGDLPTDEWIQMRRTSEAPPPSRFNPAVDCELDVLVRTALASEPGRRYATASALHEDVQRYLAGEPLNARRDSVWYLLCKSLRRRRAPLAAAATVLLALGVGGGAGLHGLIQARLAEERGAVERHKAQAESVKTEAIHQILRELIPLSDEGFQTDPGVPARRALQRLMNKVDQGLFGDQPEVTTAVHLTIARIFQERGVLQMAEVAMRVACQQAEKIYGQNSVELAQCLDQLARVLHQRGSLHEGRAVADQALALRRRLLGDRHVDVAASLETLARLALSEGRLDTAANWAYESLSIRTAIFGPEHLEAGRARMLLACVARAAGRLETAEADARAALSIRLHWQSADHAELVDNLKLLADIVAARGPVNGYADGATDGGPTDIILRSAPRLATLAQLLQREERGDDAQPQLEDLIALKRALLGDHHPLVGRALARYGQWLLERGRWAAARESLLRALTILEPEQDLGAMNLHSVYSSLAQAAWQLGDLEGCIHYARHRIDLLRRDLSGPTDIFVAIALREVADVYRLEGYFPEAERYYCEALEILEARHGAGHRDTAVCLAVYSAVLLDTGRLPEAENTAGQVLRIADGLGVRTAWYVAYAHAIRGLARARRVSASAGVELSEADTATAAARADLIEAVAISLELRSCISAEFGELVAEAARLTGLAPDPIRLGGDSAAHSRLR